MARSFQALVPLFLVRLLLALAAIAAFGLSPLHAAGRGSLDRGHPPLGAEIDLPDEAYAAVLDGDRAYVVSRIDGGYFFYSQLSVHDLSTSGPPELLGDYIIFCFDVRSFDVQGGFAYVASCQGGVVVVDVSDPAAIHDVGRLAWGPIVPECVAVAGGHAYVGDDNGLHVVDVTDPASPSILGSVALSAGTASVALDGRFAYVGTLDARVAVVDVSNPVAPVVVASLEVPGTPWDIESRGSHAYVSDGESGLQILDVSDPARPRLVGGVATPGNARRVALSGARAYVVDRGWGNPYQGERFPGKVQVIDVSNPAHPAIVNSIAGVDSIENVARWVHAEPRAVAANKGRVVVAGGVLHTWLEDCIRGPGACDYSSGYLNVTPRVAYETQTPRARTGSSPGAEADASVNTVPAMFALGSNTPGPFGATSSIRFEMPRASRVRIGVFDVRGRLVKTLVDDALPAGRHEATWRGCAENGQAVPSGVYFVSMEAETFHQTRKIMLVR